MLGKWGRLLRAVADGRDPAALPPPGEVIPTIDVGQGPLDWAYSKDVFHYGGTAYQPNVAGSYSWIGLENPDVAGVLAVIYGMSGIDGSLTGCAASLLRSVSIGGWTGSGSENALDGRVECGLQTRSSVCQVRTKATNVGTGDPFYSPIPWNYDSGSWIATYHERLFKLVLFPGQVALISGTTVNAALRWNFLWYEREYSGEEIQGIKPGIISV